MNGPELHPDARRPGPGPQPAAISVLAPRGGAGARRTEPHPSMIDETDRRILALLQEDARISNAEIGRQVGIAASAIFQRIRKLEERDIIRGYTARLDAKALGHGLVAFVQVRTATGAKAREITGELSAIPEVREVHRVIGEDCFFLKVRVGDPEALEDLLDNRIQPLRSVASTRTTIVLSTGKESFEVPLEEDSDPEADSRDEDRSGELSRRAG